MIEISFRSLLSANKEAADGLRLLSYQQGTAAFLLAQAQSFHDGTIAFDVARLQILQKATTLTYEARQCTLRAVVLAVLLHVLGQVLDAVRKERNLALGAARVCGTLAVLSENLYFLG